MASLGSVSTGLLHQEISRLNNLMKEKMSECESLEKELESTRRQGQERMQTLEQQVSCCNTISLLLGLGHWRKPNGFWFFLPQVFIYEEDFRSERADRERAQGEIADLKEQVGQLRRQLHKQVSPWTVSSNELEARAQARPTLTLSDCRQQGAGREPRDLLPVCRVHIGHRITSRWRKDSPEPVVRGTAEVQQKPAAAASAAQNPTWNGGQVLSDLQCPRCLATFSEREATECLNHCEECAKLWARNTNGQGRQRRTALQGRHVRRAEVPSWTDVETTGFKTFGHDANLCSSQFPCCSRGFLKTKTGLPACSSCSRFYWRGEISSIIYLKLPTNCTLLLFTPKLFRTCTIKRFMHKLILDLDHMVLFVYSVTIKFL